MGESGWRARDESTCFTVALPFLVQTLCRGLSNRYLTPYRCGAMGFFFKKSHHNRRILILLKHSPCVDISLCPMPASIPAHHLTSVSSRFSLAVGRGQQLTMQC